MILLIVLIFSLLIFGLMTAQSDEYTYYHPITEIDLGVRSLSITVGETYIFPMTWKPEDTPAVFITWLTDNSILEVDPENHSITALAAGNTRLLVESNGGYTWDYCDVTVTGIQSKDVLEKKNGGDVINLTKADRNKIKAKSVQNYLRFLESCSFTDQ